MMVSLAVVVWAVSVVGAFALGMWISDVTAKTMWREHNYCPTCDRLDCERFGHDCTDITP